MHCPKGENSKIPVADTVTENIYLKLFHLFMNSSMQYHQLEQYF